LRRSFRLLKQGLFADALMQLLRDWSGFDAVVANAWPLFLIVVSRCSPEFQVANAKVPTRGDDANTGQAFVLDQFRGEGSTSLARGLYWHDRPPIAFS